jgi:hypothetical protein
MANLYFGDWNLDIQEGEGEFQSKLNKEFKKFLKPLEGKVEVFHRGDMVELNFTVKKQYAGEVYLSGIEGQCGVANMSGLDVCTPQQGKRYGAFLIEAFEWMAEEFGYSSIECTTITSAAAFRHLAEARGYKELYSFRNKRTGNLIHKLYKEI